MNLARSLLENIGRRIPTIHDVIPRGPQSGSWDYRHAETMLNPQPLPPEPPDQLGAAVAAEFAHLAWLADRLGIDVSRAFADLEEWCPTRPRWPKLPPGWWRRWPVPEPRPNWLAEYHLGFAARLAAIAADYTGTGFAKSLDPVIERSGKAIAEMQKA